MSWQDIVLGGGNVLLALALIPSLRSPDKPHVRTSLVTAGVLASFSAAFISLELFYSAAAVSVSSIMWFALAYQKHRQHR